MNLKNVVPALAIVLAASAVSFASESQFLAGVTGAAVKVREGASSISLIRSAKTVNSSSNWKTIAKNVYPEWPGIQFPDGQSYRIDGLCVAGANLKVTHTKTGTKCVESVNNEGGDQCLRSAKVALVTPRKYTAKTCVQWATGTMPIGGGSEGNDPSSYKYCAKTADVDGEHAIKYLVAVHGTPNSGSEGEVGGAGALLFKKQYRIPACN